MEKADECMERVYSSMLQSQRADLKIAYERRERMKQELLDFTELEHTIKIMSENKDVAENGLQTTVNLGCDFFIDAHVKKPETILINVGLDVFLECTFPDALKLIASKQKIIEHQMEYMTCQIAQIESYISLSLMALGPQANFYPYDCGSLQHGRREYQLSIFHVIQDDLLNRLKQ